MSELTPLEFQPAPRLSSLDRVSEAMATLAPRQIQILGLIANGLSRCQIGQELSLAPKTVKNYSEDVALKLSVPNKRAILITTAHATGWFAETGCEVPSNQECPYGPETFRSGFVLLDPVFKGTLAKRASGFTTEEVAISSFLSPKTVKGHHTRLTQGLLGNSTPHAQSMPILIAATWLEGLIEVPEPAIAHA